MNYIFLIGNESFDLELLKKVKYLESIDAYDVKGESERYYVDFGNEHIFYDVITDFNDFVEDIMLVPYNKPSIIMMTYTSKEIVRYVLGLGDFPQDIYIDNEFGIIVSLREFVDMGMPMA